MIIDEHSPIPDLADGGTDPSPPSVLPARQADSRRGELRPAPDLVGLEESGAQAIARATDVRLSVSVWQTTVGPWGLVLEQWPRAGTRVGRGTSLRIWVSGRPYQQVPDVQGLAIDTAIERLGWLGFIPLLMARRASSTVPGGHIISSRPQAGTLLAPDSVVALTVARTPRPDPDCAAVTESPSPGTELVGDGADHD